MCLPQTVRDCQRALKTCLRISGTKEAIISAIDGNNFYFLSLLSYLQNKFSELMWMGFNKIGVFKNWYWGCILELMVMVRLQGRHQSLWDCKGWYFSHWHLSWDIGHDRNVEYLIRDVMKWNSHHPLKCCRVTLMLLN